MSVPIRCAPIQRTRMKPAVLIPSPYVAENHQYHNAMALVNKKAASVIEEKDLTSEKVIEEVLKLKNHPQLLEEMSRASRACAPDHALDIIYNTIRQNV